MNYVGRFAPSPTGPLHLGSIVAAAASYLDARAQQGQWLIRIEDLDTGRSDPATARLILDTLANLGMKPDRPPTFQTHQQDRYRDAVTALHKLGWTYACACTRSEIRAAGRPAGIYPGTCRAGLPSRRSGRTTRLRLDQPQDEFTDRFAGYQLSRINVDYGDPAVIRADGSFAYVLAGALDDVLDGITDVVRGDDLLPTTASQRLLLAKLGLPPPRYAHIPVLLGSDGRKLSKQNHAPAVDAADPVPVLQRALNALGLAPYLDLSTPPGGMARLWDAATLAWADWLKDRNATISR